jgi:hypothetical protein
MIELGSHAGIGLKSNMQAAPGFERFPDHNATLIKRIRSRRAPQDRLEDQYL